MKNIALVTGTAGFVGRHLIPLLNQTHDVYGFDPKYKPEGMQIASYFREPFQRYLNYGLFPEFDVIVHLAANIKPIDLRMKPSIEAYQDIVLDYQMASFVEAHPPKRAFIYMSSCAVDTPQDPYGWVKQTGEKTAKALYSIGVPVVILRPFSGYGADQDESYPFPAILKRVLSGMNPVEIWGSGYQIRDWIHVDDLARAIVWAIESGPRGVPIDIGTGVGTSMFKLAEMMAKYAERKIEVLANEEKPESGKSRIAESIVAKSYGFAAKISLEDGVRSAVEEWKAKNAAAA